MTHSVNNRSDFRHALERYLVTAQTLSAINLIKDRFTYVANPRYDDINNALATCFKTRQLAVTWTRQLCVHVCSLSDKLASWEAHIGALRTQLEQQFTVLDEIGKPLVDLSQSSGDELHFLAHRVSVIHVIIFGAGIRNWEKLICFDAHLSSESHEIIRFIYNLREADHLSQATVRDMVSKYRQNVQSLCEHVTFRSAKMNELYNPIFEFVTNTAQTVPDVVRRKHSTVTMLKTLSPEKVVDGASKKPNVVVLDDDKTVASLFTQSLKHNCLEYVDVVTSESDDELFTSAQQLMTLFERNPAQPDFDLLITDEDLGGKAQVGEIAKGSELLRKLRSERARLGLPMIPAISVTGRLKLDIFDQADVAPCLVYFAKPINTAVHKMITATFADCFSTKQNLDERHLVFAWRLLFKPRGRNLTAIEEAYFKYVESGNQRTLIEKQRAQFEDRMNALLEKEDKRATPVAVNGDQGRVDQGEDEVESVVSSIDGFDSVAPGGNVREAKRSDKIHDSSGGSGQQNDKPKRCCVLM